MQAIILAAGRGKRMGSLTSNHPKALLSMHGKPLIEWQMGAIRAAGIADIAIVRGYQAHVFNYPVTYFDNPRWQDTNMLSTLMCADEWLRNNACIVSYSDIVYTKEAIDVLVDSNADVTLAYDPNWRSLWEKRFAEPLSDAETFIHRDGVLLDIGEKTDDYSYIQGQYMGLIKITPAGWKTITTFLNSQPQHLIDKLDMTGLFKLMLKNNSKIAVRPISTPWCEIDNQIDYQLCCDIFSPEL